MRKVRDLDRRAGRHRLPPRFRRRAVHLVLGVAAVLVWRAPVVAAITDPTDTTPPPAGEVPATVPPTTAVATTGPTTGPTTDPTTDMAVVPPVGQADAGQPLTDSERASRTLRLVTIGLVALAATVLVVSVVFWRRTSPGRLMAQEAAQVGTVRRVVRADSASWSTEPNWAGGALRPTVDVSAGAVSPAFHPPAPAHAASGSVPQGSPWSDPTAGRGVPTAPPSHAPAGHRAPVRTPSPVSASHPHGLWASSGWDDPAEPAAQD